MSTRAVVQSAEVIPVKCSPTSLREERDQIVERESHPQRRHVLAREYFIQGQIRSGVTSYDPRAPWSVGCHHAAIERLRMTGGQDNRAIDLRLS
ncbi:hypothetical protein AXK56_11740 [Tsukamurella pulmonis]|nr:hypothetical protein AXK56_11740 [Tsukamurella pulmonis]